MPVGVSDLRGCGNCGDGAEREAWEPHIDPMRSGAATKGGGGQRGSFERGFLTRTRGDPAHVVPGGGEGHRRGR